MSAIPFWFELLLLCLLVCIAFPFSLIGVVLSDRAQARSERQSMVLSAGAAVLVAGAWFAVMMY
jgi:hypothetical protein